MIRAYRAHCQQETHALQQTIDYSTTSAIATAASLADMRPSSFATQTCLSGRFYACCTTTIARFIRATRQSEALMRVTNAELCTITRSARHSLSTVARRCAEQMFC